jgi:plastocyanin
MVVALVGCGGEAPPPPEQPQQAQPEATPAPPTGYQEMAVTSGGGITGKVTVTGDVPEPETVEVNKDTSVCGTEKTIQDIKVGEGGVLADAVVWIEDIDEGKAWPNGSAGSVDQSGCTYLPHIQALRPGANLDVINSDAVLHNIHAYAGEETLFNIAQPMQGQKTSKQLPDPGPVHLKCDVHSWMSAWVFVATTPYYAITAEDGSFSLDDVPPGSYTLKVWHGVFGEQSISLDVEPGGAVTSDFTLQAS